MTPCACGMDIGCNLHDHPAAALPSGSPHVAVRASSRRRVLTPNDRLHATLSLLILVGALLAFWWVGR